MIDQLAYYLTFAFVRNALIVGLLTSLSAALLGVVLGAQAAFLLGGRLIARGPSARWPSPRR
jgi:ABC-type Mn2+/Zn2+ transport system permease subunit